MEQKIKNKSHSGKRAEERTLVGKYYSVEFLIKGLDMTYQFKILDISPGGMCILVREDSDAIGHLKVGEVFKMKYYPTELLSPVDYFETRVRHVTKDQEGRFQGHFMIGLSILE
jgi:hypothetical protein